MQKKKKQKKWMKFRHRVVRNIAFCILYPYSRMKYGIKVEKFREQGDRPYLILFNHQTAFDQFFVGMAFRGPVYYVASEDLFSMGWVSKLIRWAVAPIPIKKQTTDLNAVMTCIRVAREGGTIAIAPEGNRTFSGETVYMSDAIAPLAKKLKLPIALYRLEGGYGVQPRWSDEVRKGKMRGYVAHVIEPEEYAAMSNEELFARIKEQLYVNEANDNHRFRSERQAEFLERALYVCPDCGFVKLESHGNEIHCTKCGKTFVHGEDKRITGKGFASPFPFVKQWYDYQQKLVNELDVSAWYDTPVFTDTADLSEVVIYQDKKPMEQGVAVSLYGNRITLAGKADTWEFPFEEVSAVTVLGKNKLNIYHNKRVYQLKSDERFNALKYVNLFHRYKNVMKGEENGEFLGL